MAGPEIHLWRVCLDQGATVFSQCEKALSRDERERARRFHFSQDQRRHIVGRGLLRIILGRYLGMDPAEIVFFNGGQGKPRLAPATNGDLLHFNVSHSEGLALYAVTRHREVGIDVERVRPLQEAEQIAGHFFSGRENAEWRSLPDSRRQEAFFNLWTRKEACLKASGEGIGERLSHVDVWENSGAVREIPAIVENSSATSRWLLWNLRPAPGYVAALAINADWFLPKQLASGGPRLADLKAARPLANRT